MNKEGWTYLFVACSFALLFAISAPQAFAADPQFLVTWKSETKVPVWYEGKILPIRESSLLVSVTLIDQNGSSAGKMVNLENSEVRWYLKGNLVDKGRGMTSLSVFNKDFSGNYIDVKITISYTDAENGTRFVETRRSIPIVSPEAVIEYRNLQPTFSPGSDVVIRGYPFFFSSSFLKSKWDIDGVQKMDDVYDLRIQNAPEQLKKIRFSVQNPSKTLERAESSVSLRAN